MHTCGLIINGTVTAATERDALDLVEQLLPGGLGAVAGFGSRRSTSSTTPCGFACCSGSRRGRRWTWNPTKPFGLRRWNETPISSPMGTRMVNEKIPLTVIQKVLHHGSIEMTAHYARLHDETVKQEVRRWHERVNICGERIAPPVDGPLQEAAWMKERTARAKQALPNGYCGLPLVQRCPHPCLSCASFLTDGSLRAVHEQQHGEACRLLEKARKHNLRLIDVFARDEQSLSRILEGLEAIEADHPAGGEIHLLDLAAPDQTEDA